MNYIKGIINALVGAVTFGLIPLFALLILASGMAFYNVLFYRMVFACLGLAGIMIFMKKSFKVDLHLWPMIALLALCNSLCTFFLLIGYEYISSGLATSIHFLYPVFVSVAMICFFGEKKSFWTGLSIFMAILGVSLLSGGDENVSISLVGVIVILISSVWYAIYLVGTSKSRVGSMDAMVYTFYIMLCGAFYYLAYAIATDSFQMIPFDGAVIGNLLGLAVLATLLSNLVMVDALQRIGSTMTAVLGAMEPLTAVMIGVWVFHEPFTQKIAYSIACILGSVIVVILSKNIKPIKSKCLLRFKNNLIAFFHLPGGQGESRRVDIQHPQNAAVFPVEEKGE